MNTFWMAALGAFGVLVTAAAAWSLWLHYRAGSTYELRSQLRQIDLDVADLYERLDSFTKRANVRAGRERAANAEAQAATASVDRKAALRAKLAAQVAARGVVQ